MAHENNSVQLSVIEDSNTSHNDVPHSNDGCVVLARNSASGHQYVTRFYIDRHAQRHHETRDVIKENLAPCCLNENRTSCLATIWNFLRSELFLISIHLTVIILGVLKGFIHTRDTMEQLHIAHAAMETVAALLAVVIRTVSGKLAVKSVPKHHKRLEHVTHPSDLLSHKFTKWAHTYVILGSMFAVVVIVQFGVLLYFKRLEFTVVANQFVMVVMTLASGITLDAIQSAKAKISEDQHLAVLHEAALLLSEAYNLQTESRQAEARQRTHRFLRGLAETELLQRPAYLNLAKHERSDRDGSTVFMISSSF